jgi:hypothetical protein
MARQSNTREYLEGRMREIADLEDDSDTVISIAELRTILHHALDKLSLMDEVAELKDEIRRLEEIVGDEGQ